jgi:hypothetical protein
MSTLNKPCDPGLFLPCRFHRSCPGATELAQWRTRPVSQRSHADEVLRRIE